MTVSPNFIRGVIRRVPTPVVTAVPTSPQYQDRLTIEVDGGMLPMRDVWKEAKVVTFTWDAHRDSSQNGHRGSVSEAYYAATLGRVEAFETLVHQAMPSFEQRQSIREVIWLSDGAPWIWELASRVCPHAIQILDWSHAIEHAADCGKILMGEDTGWCELWNEHFKRMLMEGRVHELIAELEAVIDINKSSKQRKALKALLTYYRHHQHRMNYKQHREHGRMIGSGIVESAHRHVLQVRMKRAGQHWSENGAEKMVRLRALYRTVGVMRFYDALHRNQKPALPIAA